MTFIHRAKRGLVLARDSIVLLRHNPRLGAFPLVGGASAIAFLALVFGATFGVLEVVGSDALAVGLLVLAYVVTSFLSVFFAAALVAETRRVLDGADPDLRRGLRAAWRVKGKLFAWALVSATVGLLLRAIEGSDSRVGNVLRWVFSVAWTAMTFFVVPTAVLEPDTSVRDMFTESGSLFKSLWGETAVGIAGLELITVAVFAPGGLVAYAVWETVGHTAAAVAIVVVSAAIAMLVTATVRGVIKTSLYVYATEGKRPSEFENRDFDDLAG